MLYEVLLVILAASIGAISIVLIAIYAHNDWLANQLVNRRLRRQLGPWGRG